MSLKHPLDGSQRNLWRLYACVVTLLLTTAAADGAEPKPISPEALKLHESSLVFDGHSNLLKAIRTRRASDAQSADLTRVQPGLHTDFPRLRQGGLGAEFFATYVSAESVTKGKAVVETLEQIDAIKQLLSEHPEAWELATTSSDVVRLHRDRRLAGLITIENGAAIQGSLAVLKTYHQAGVRCLAVTHDDSHDWADAALDRSVHGGLSKFGTQVVGEANRLGILLDLSHASEETVRDAMEATRAPVIFSHSGASQLADHPRNVSDDTLRLVAKNGGVVHVNFFPAFLTAKSVKAYMDRSKAAHALKKSIPNPEHYRLALQQWLAENPLPPTSAADVVDHIDHIVKIAGIDHVGLGSNFDGIVSVPSDLTDVSCFPRVTQELLDRGYSAEQIRKILGENTLRVLREVERVASSSQPAAVSAASRR